eukprot:COSAG02_NODE_2361_length_9063_cov_3.936859_11_plen_151_part_00
MTATSSGSRGERMRTRPRRSSTGAVRSAYSTHAELRKCIQLSDSTLYSHVFPRISRLLVGSRTGATRQYRTVGREFEPRGQLFCGNDLAARARHACVSTLVWGVVTTGEPHRLCRYSSVRPFTHVQFWHCKLLGHILSPWAALYSNSYYY